MLSIEYEGNYGVCASTRVMSLMSYQCPPGAYFNDIGHCLMLVNKPLVPSKDWYMTVGKAILSISRTLRELARNSFQLTPTSMTG